MKRVRIALSGAGGYGGFYLPYLLENKWNLPMSSWAWWSRMPAAWQPAAPARRTA